MALFWRQRTIAATSSAARSVYSHLLNTWSPSSLEPSTGEVLQLDNTLPSTSTSSQRVSALSASAVSYELPFSAMTTVRPPSCPGPRVRRIRQSGHEGDGNDSKPSCSYVSHVRKSSGGLPREGSEALPRTTAVGLAAAAITTSEMEGESSPSSTAIYKHLQSEETVLNLNRKSCRQEQQVQNHHTHEQQRQALRDEMSEQEHGARLPSISGKSAKRREAEALLAARLGGAASADLHRYLPHDMAVPYPYQVRHVYLSECCIQLPAGLHAVGNAAAATSSTCGCFDGAAAAGCRHLSSSSRILSDPSSSGAAANGPAMPAAAAAADAAGVADDGDDNAEGDAAAALGSSVIAESAGISSSISVLQRQLNSLVAATAGRSAKAAKLKPPSELKLERVIRSRTAAGIATTQRQNVHVSPPPPSKRARLSLSEATTISLGGGLAGTGTQPSAKAAKTTVPPCDPARGCKARLLEAAAAAAPRRIRSGSSLADEGGSGAIGNGPVGGGGGSLLSLEAVEPGQNTAAAAAAVAGSGTAGVVEPMWCAFEVTLPPVNWQAVFDEPPGALQRYSIARGYEKLLLPQGLVTYVVENERHIGDALRNLKAGMQDRLVAIDLEWRPETVSGRVSPVALLQLSSASVCLAVRTCCMGHNLPTELKAFLEDPAHVLLGFGWDSADESKMRSTFGMGRAHFRRFLDLQAVAASLGYHGFGLSRLSQQVLGLPLHKPKSISRSNWAAPQLTNHQLKYASLDVLVAGQLFRALRLWHSFPSPCADCRSPIGELLLPGPMRCGQPGCTTQPAANLQQHRDHCAATGHPARFAACGTCGRLYELAAATAAELSKP